MELLSTHGAHGGGEGGTALLSALPGLELL